MFHVPNDWEEGNYGKGIVWDDGTVNAWKVDSGGNPHHIDYDEDGTAVQFAIMPDGRAYTVWGADRHVQGRDMTELLGQRGLTYVDNYGDYDPFDLGYWALEPKVGRFEEPTVIEVSTGTGEHGEVARAFVYDKKANTVLLGGPGSSHAQLFDAVHRQGIAMDHQVGMQRGRLGGDGLVSFYNFGNAYPRDFRDPAVREAIIRVLGGKGEFGHDDNDYSWYYARRLGADPGQWRLNLVPWQPGQHGKAIIWDDGSVTAWDAEKSTAWQNGGSGYVHHAYVEETTVGKRSMIECIMEPNGQMNAYEANEGWRRLPKSDPLYLKAKDLLNLDDGPNWNLASRVSQVVVPKGAKPWEPGKRGKGLIGPNNEVYLWDSTADWAPHHPDVMTDVDPEAYNGYSLVDEGLNHRLFTVHPDGEIAESIWRYSVRPDVLELILQADPRLRAPGSQDWQFEANSADPNWDPRTILANPLQWEEGTPGKGIIHRGVMYNWTTNAEGGANDLWGGWPHHNTVISGVLGLKLYDPDVQSFFIHPSGVVTPAFRDDGKELDLSGDPRLRQSGMGPREDDWHLGAATPQTPPGVQPYQGAGYGKGLYEPSTGNVWTWQTSDHEDGEPIHAEIAEKVVPNWVNLPREQDPVCFAIRPNRTFEVYNEEHRPHADEIARRTGLTLNPDESFWNTFEYRGKVAGAPQVVEVSNVPEKMREFGWRRPVLYDEEQKKVYIGPPGGTHYYLGYAINRPYGQMGRGWLSLGENVLEPGLAYNESNIPPPGMGWMVPPSPEVRSAVEAAIAQIVPDAANVIDPVYDKAKDEYWVLGAYTPTITVKKTNDSGTAADGMMDDRFNDRRPILFDYANDTIYVGGYGMYHEDVYDTFGISDPDLARGAWYPRGNAGWGKQPGEVQWFSGPPRDKWNAVYEALNGSSQESTPDWELN